VREVLRILEAEGLLEHIPDDGGCSPAVPRSQSSSTNRS
jgi:DNA-binding GntR family transcriptional regulator